MLPHIHNIQFYISVFMTMGSVEISMALPNKMIQPLGTQNTQGGQKGRCLKNKHLEISSEKATGSDLKHSIKQNSKYFLNYFLLKISTFLKFGAYLLNL